MYPKIIALCGNPLSGKSEVARIISAEHDYQPVDSGLPLREIGMTHFGLTANQVFTQEGKTEKFNIAEREFEVREFLGELGNAIEEKFGENAMPHMSAMQFGQYSRYVISGVRRNQGHFWKTRGAVVVEVNNPDAPPSQYEFDSYDQRAVDYIIQNRTPDLSDPEAVKTGLWELSNKISNMFKTLAGA